jgi:hypothetical protein
MPVKFSTLDEGVPLIEEKSHVSPFYEACCGHIF